MRLSACIQWLMREIRCRFIILARKDEPVEIRCPKSGVSPLCRFAAPGMMKMGWALVAYGWRRVSGRRPILMEPRARVSVSPGVAAYPVLLPPTLGSTWTRMSPSRRPPTLLSGDQSV